MARNSKRNASNKDKPAAANKKAPAAKKPRTNFFTKDLWWMVDLTMTPVPTQGATPLVLRCMNEYDWSVDKARSVLAGYKQFLQHQTTKQRTDGNGSSNDDIDKMWRMHILDTRNYAADCMQLCNGTVVHYNPDGAKNNGKARTKRGRGKQSKQPGSGSDASAEVGIYGPQKTAKAPPAAAAPLDPHSMEKEEGEIENVRPITIKSRDETDQNTFFKLEEQQPNGKFGVGRWGHNQCHADGGMSG